MEYPEEEALNIYTDGSMVPDPRRGGIGAIFILLDTDGEEEIYEPPTAGYVGATNNQMELQAQTPGLRGLSMRLNGVEPSRPSRGTRPST